MSTLLITLGSIFLIVLFLALFFGLLVGKSTSVPPYKKTLDVEKAEIEARVWKEHLIVANRIIDRQKLEIGKLQSELYSARRPAALDQSLVKRLRRLVHPDKHNNSQASNEAFKELEKYLK